jgi:hypothetical protein
LSSSDSDSDNEPPPPPEKTSKRATTAQGKVAEEAATLGSGLDRRETIRRFELKEAQARRQAGRAPQGLPEALRQHATATAAAASTDAAARALHDAASARGPRWCAACRRDGCAWRASCDVGAVASRRRVLAQEMHYIRVQSADQATLESYVPLSAMRGGSIKFRR